MKKILLFGLLSVSLGLYSVVPVNSQQANNSTPEAQVLSAFDMPPSVIDGIEVPNDVLMDVQMQYPGYAVTKASKIVRNVAEVYQLTVDQDDRPVNNPLIYLLYDMNWQFISEEKFTPSQPTAKPKEEDKKDEDDHEGRGGGFLEEGEEPTSPEDNSGEEDSEEDPEDEPDEEPEDPPADDTPPVEPTP